MSTLYRALRGVCIGPERHLAPGDPPVPLDKATAQFLTAIGAVEEVPDEPAPAKPASTEPPQAAAAAPAAAASEPAPAKPGKKEK
jgi:hypothetical protein